MQKILSAFSVVFVLMTGPSLAQHKSSASDKAMTTAQAVEKQVVELFNKKDAAALAARYTSDGVYISPDGKAAVGNAAIEAAYANTMKAWGNFKFSGEVQKAHAVGNGYWSYTIATVDGNGASGPIKSRSHVLTVIVPAGKSWKIAITSIGADVSPPSAPVR